MSSLRGRAWTYTVLIAIGLLCALPNVLPQSLADRLPGWYVQNTVTLGLDLRGGSHLLLQVDTSELAGEDTLRFAERLGAELQRAGISHQGVHETSAGRTIPLTDATDGERALALAWEMAPKRQGEGGQRAYTVTLDGPALVMKPTPAHLKALAADAVERSLDIVRQRLNATGVVEPTVARQGNDALIVQLPGLDDPARIRDLLGTTAKLTFHLAADDRSAPGDTVTLPDVDSGTQLRLAARPALDGEHLTDARLGFEESSGDPLVSFELDSEGARRFSNLTRDNIGRVLAIVLDDQVISAPVIRGRIGATGQISGSFTVAEASDLALLLRAGALPAPLEVVEERTVGPDLGSDAIAMGLTTGLIGAALVVLSLFALYGRWGTIAASALALNVALIFAALSLLGATLTLPGIAGIVLAIGMAVDANILINERIREEVRQGRKPMAALEAGFKRAYGTIVDANVTTLIATSLLVMFGSGPVRGFAVTIAIGLIMSLFTAVAVARLMMEWRVRQLRRQPLAIGGIDLAGRVSGQVIGFMRARYLGLAVSALLSVAALVLLVQPGLHRGVDFAGGTAMEVHLPGAGSVDTLRRALGAHGLADAAIQQFGPTGEFLIRAPAAAEGQQASAVVEQIQSAVRSVEPAATFPRVDMVGPRVSESFIENAILAVLLAGLGMLAYLWVRFEWPFAVAATLTLVLDLTKMLGFFALFGIEFNLAAIAALLTLIGYSVNDKVVIFDRIRENLRTDPREPLATVFDRSITATLTRTLFTSLTTFLAILPMAVAGGAAVSSFAIPMLFGIVLCTSSSIFIAAPLVLLLADRWVDRHRFLTGTSETDEGPAPARGVDLRPSAVGGV
jgi:SecD/SecF fusion protein